MPCVYLCSGVPVCSIFLLWKDALQKNAVMLSMAWPLVFRQIFIVLPTANFVVSHPALWLSYGDNRGTPCSLPGKLATVGVASSAVMSENGILLIGG